MYLSLVHTSGIPNARWQETFDNNSQIRYKKLQIICMFDRCRRLNFIRNHNGICINTMLYLFTIRITHMIFLPISDLASLYRLLFYLHFRGLLHPLRRRFLMLIIEKINHIFYDIFRTICFNFEHELQILFKKKVRKYNYEGEINPLLTSVQFISA